MGLGRIVATAVLAFGMAGSAGAQQAVTPPPKEYGQQFLVQGSWFHGVHGLAFNKDDQLFAGSVIGQTLYRVQVDSGEVDRVIDPPTGMADDIAFADDGTMAWTAFLIGKVYVSTVLLFDIGVYMLVIGATVLILVALAHQSLRVQRKLAAMAAETEHKREGDSAWS